MNKKLLTILCLPLLYFPSVSMAGCHHHRNDPPKGVQHKNHPLKPAHVVRPTGDIKYGGTDIEMENMSRNR